MFTATLRVLRSHDERFSLPGQLFLKNFPTFFTARKYGIAECSRAVRLTETDIKHPGYLKYGRTAGRPQRGEEIFFFTWKCFQNYIYSH